MKILFILLRHVLSSYILRVYHNYFYIVTDFLNKTNSQTCIPETEECLYLGTVRVYAYKKQQTFF
jgi:hypothetical protein